MCDDVRARRNVIAALLFEAFTLPNAR